MPWGSASSSSSSSSSSRGSGSSPGPGGSPAAPRRRLLRCRRRRRQPSSKSTRTTSEQVVRRERPDTSFSSWQIHTDIFFSEGSMMQPGRRWRGGSRVPLGRQGQPSSSGGRIGARDPRSLQHRPVSPLRTEGKLRRCSAGTVRSKSRAPGLGLPRLRLCPRFPGPLGFAPPHVAPPPPAPSAGSRCPNAGGRSPGPSLSRAAGLGALQCVCVRGGLRDPSSAGPGACA